MIILVKNMWYNTTIHDCQQYMFVEDYKIDEEHKIYFSKVSSDFSENTIKSNNIKEMLQNISEILTSPQLFVEYDIAYYDDATNTIVQVPDNILKNEIKEMLLTEQYKSEDINISENPLIIEFHNKVIECCGSYNIGYIDISKETLTNLCVPFRVLKNKLEFGDYFINTTINKHILHIISSHGGLVVSVVTDQIVNGKAVIELYGFGIKTNKDKPQYINIPYDKLSNIITRNKEITTNQVFCDLKGNKICAEDLDI